VFDQINAVLVNQPKPTSLSDPKLLNGVVYSVIKNDMFIFIILNYFYSTMLH